ncbi:acyl-CoA thioesterase [Petropleomorpha daqingensis]|uniref:Acyl-CoA thioesterase-2 n=1 Tax=Petropleomorpha daqingensis TaxID=2026353 RepID=A0A853CJT5_9ACTN|nr:acyl-CoA thioesterase-2 [Petropleomorpha daqingensis]
MSESTAPLMAVLGLEEREEDVFVGQTPTTPSQRVFGGQVAGQALMAAGLTTPGDRSVHSLHSYFLRPGDPNEEIRYVVERIRDGRTFSTRRVLAHQRRKGEDVAIYALTADFTAGERALAEHSLPMPDVPGPEGLPGIPDVVARHPERGAFMEAMSAAVEQRFLEDPFSPVAKKYPDTQHRTWLRVAGRLPDDPAVHAAALTFASDLTLLSSGVARLGVGWGGFMGASLDHTVWFHRPMRPDEWFLYEGDSPVASAGRALCIGQIWTVDGEHVATVAQEGLIRAVRE